MFSVFIKPCYYLVKYRILYISFLMIPSISHCVGEEIEKANLNSLQSEIATLNTTVTQHISTTLTQFSEISEQYDRLLGKIDTSSKTPENVNEMVDKLLKEILPKASDALRDLSTTTSILHKDSLNLQSSAYRIMSDCNVKLGSIEQTAGNYLTELIRLKADCEVLVSTSRTIQADHLLMGRGIDTLNSTLSEFNKLVSNFKVDFGVANKLLENYKNELHRTHGDFEKLGETFTTTVDEKLKELSETCSNKVVTDVTKYMDLTGRLNKLKSNLVDAVNQANLPKECKFDTPMVADYLQKSDIEGLKTDWNNISDYSELKPYLEQGFSKMAETRGILNDTERLADFSLEILSSFSFNN